MQELLLYFLGGLAFALGLGAFTFNNDQFDDLFEGVATGTQFFLALVWPITLMGIIIHVTAIELEDGREGDE